MICHALTKPEILSNLICELDGIRMVERSSAYLCVGPSIEDPGRNRIWIIPKDTKAGANPSLWIKQNYALLENELKQPVVHCTIIFAGDLPREVQYNDVFVRNAAGTPGNKQIRRRPHVARKEVRCVSAATHLYVDRLRFHTPKGNIDSGKRDNIIKSLATQYWNDEKEYVYVSPTLMAVRGGPSISADTRELIVQKKPSLLEHGLIVLYGPGGIGKTFFLNRLAHIIGNQTKANLLVSVPIFVHPPALLHKQALENWLSQHGFGKLTLDQITSFIRYGIIIPLVDALDEVVKGEARQGAQEFLRHLVELTSLKGVHGRGILACRDYYLNSDSLVPEIVRESKEYPTAELSFGFFDKRDRRRYLQTRAKLEPRHASRWAAALESQAAEVLGSQQAEEVEELIGHPVVLDTLARYILDLPSSQRITTADEFKITSSDIFGQIIDQLLKRERDKLTPSWKTSFHDRLKPDWHDPMDPQKQRKVLQGLTLIVAKDGAEETEIKAQEDDSYRTLKHGVLLFTKGIRQAANRREAMQQIVKDALGTPEVVDSIPNGERDAIVDEALGHLAESYLSHILADTEPVLPEDLIFAFRHRTYFDYFLADALVTHLEDAVRTKKADSFIQWCQTHHVFETFGTCLDFILWDPRVNGKGMEHIYEFIEKAKIGDDDLASYILSLALTVFLRRGLHLEDIAIKGLSLAPHPSWELLLIREMLAPSISGLSVIECSFPKLTIDSISFAELVLDSCDFEVLRIVSSDFYKCSIVGLECKELRLEGKISFQQSELDMEEGSVMIDEDANVEFHNCKVSSNILEVLDKYRLEGYNVTLDNVTIIHPPVVSFIPLSDGRRFLNKIMALARRGGRREFSIYQYKLRDRTPGTDEQFLKAVSCLEDHGCIKKHFSWIVLTPLATNHMYSFRPSGEPKYEGYRDFWDPIVEELDQILQ